MLLQYAAACIFHAVAVIFYLAIYGGFIMLSMPILYQNEKYFIVDKNTLKLYNLMFAGFVFIDGIRYKKFQAYDKKLLLEV